MRIAIIGGGAAGFFLAINLKLASPKAKITIFEKSSKLLAKVAISGGGRCNLTNSFAEIKDLAKAYPRGAKLMKRAFKTFNYQDAYQWFESNGVPLVTQEDQCVFPRSQNAQSIIDCFLHLSAKLGITVKKTHTLVALTKAERYTLSFSEAEDQTADIVVITTGGSPKAEPLEYLKRLGQEIVAPVPSLFTFNIPNDSIRELMGVVADNALVSLQGSKIKASGALLITHWGMSGPAILKLSSYAATLLSEKQYSFNIQVNWVNEPNFDKVTEHIDAIIAKNPRKMLTNIRPYDISSRLWLFLLQKADISPERTWGELGRKGINRIINVLSNDEYSVHGKGRFRDEFVTCGGVSLDSIEPNTMESKHTKGLYFAGEVLDIDAITGGFNFQAAWSTAYIAAQAIAKTIAQG